MFGADKGQINLADKGRKLYIGIVRSRFNAIITQSMLDACMAELLHLGVQEKHIDLIEVPGALEIPLALKMLARKDEYDALIALGCVIRGDTYHFELVCNESASGITRVALDYEVPILNTILTVENEQQAWTRSESKARDAALGAVEMATIVNSLA